MTLIELLQSQLSETATAVPDPEHGEHVMAVDGLIDLGALAALVLEHAADIVDGLRVPDPRHPGLTLQALPYQVRNHLNTLAKEYRA
jgi:hypothetical protein